jgi:hypothetical protein
MSALSPGGPAFLSGFAMKSLRQDQRQTPVAAEKQRRVTHLHALPVAGDGFDKMRLISERQLTAVTISNALPPEAVKWIVKFVAATSRSFCPRDRKGNGSVSLMKRGAVLRGATTELLLMA